MNSHGVSPDIADRSAADLAMALRDAEARHRDLFESALACFYRTTAAGRILECNVAFARVFGYEPEELRGHRAQELYFEGADRERALRVLRASEGRVASGEARMRRKDGSAAWVVFSERLRRADGDEVIEGTLIDITARREAEMALQERQHRMSQALRAARAGAWEWDMRSGRVLWSDENFELLGYAPGSVEARYEDWLARVHPEDRAFAQRAVEQAVARRGDLDVQFRVVRPDGSTRWIRDVGRMVFDATGAPTGMYGIQIDVTERAQAEEALRISEHRLQLLVSEMPVILFVLDREGLFELSEGRGLAVLGLRPGEVVGRSAFEMYKDHPEVVAQLRRALLGETTHATLEVGARIFETAYTPVRDAAGSPNGVVGVAVDVTERRIFEEELRRNQRLDSIGVLAGGLAHDFNNLLTSILANVSLAKDEPSYAERRSYLEDAEQASARARDLTRQLLTFARGGAPVRRTLSLHKLLHEASSFALAGTSAIGEVDADPDLWPVDADEGQLAQVLNNLLLNAVQSMPQGGRVVSRARNRPASSSEEGASVELSIEDQGTGILPEHLPRIFDPYFTTKQRGSGLGLAVVHSVVRAHGGRVRVESVPGKGSRFTVELPASPGASVATSPAGEGPAAGRGRILVMDDEPLVRKTAERALSRLGYEVVPACDGVEALRLFQAERKAGRGFEAVVLDLTVPGGMGGEETIRRLLEIDPEVKAIVSSGYASGNTMADFRAHGFKAALEKPWRLDDLGEVLHQVVGT